MMRWGAFWSETEVNSDNFYPLAGILAGLAAGIGLAEWADIRLGLIMIALLALAGILKRRLVPLLVAAALLGGFIYWSLDHPEAPCSPPRYLARKPLVVLDRPQLRDGTWRFIGWLPEEEMKVRVFCPETQKVVRGNRLVVSGPLREISGATNPGEFDYREFWGHRDVFFNLILDQDGILKREANQTSLYLRSIDGVINRGQQSVRSHMGPEEAVIMEGMLFGFQGEISDQQFADFQKSGLVHLFSVSGFHTGFIVLIGVAAANVLTRRRWARLALVSGLLLLYGFITGWPSPMIRASIMAILALAAHYLGRDQEMATSLALAGIVILLINPANLFEISFQLSFMATAGIIMLYPRWRDRARPWARWQDLVLLSLAPQAASLPIALYYFNLVSLIAVVANLLLVNVAGAAVILGFGGVVLAQLSQSMSGLLMVPAGLLTRIIEWGAAGLGGMPGGYFQTARPEEWMIVMAYLGMALLWIPEIEYGMLRLVRQWPGGTALEPVLYRTRLIGGLMLGLFVVMLIIPGQWRDPGCLKVVFIDVGQGDAIFVKTPGGYTILIDGGGSEFTDVGKKVVLPYLRRQGIRHLDLAIATHPHIDHLQGLKSVLAECPADVVVAGRGCFTTAAEAGGRLLVLEGGRIIEPDESTQLWLWAPTSKQIEEIGNETSVAARIAVGEVSFLLTGDAGPPEYEWLLKQRLPMEATVLKLPHHGSKYSWSNELAARASPDYGVVCVGERNFFGHPDPGVLRQAEDLGMEIFRTDRDGAVTFLTRGGKLQIRTGP